MSARSVRSVLLARLPRRDDDRGSIPFLILVMIMTVALGGVLMSLIIDQTRTSRFDQSRVRSLNVAQAGVDWVLGQVRTAVSAANAAAGDASVLPCGPWTNITPDNNSTTSFTATIAYYVANPTTMTSAQRTSNMMVCSPSNGTYDTASATRTPRFAVVTSTGVDNGTSGNGTSIGRTIESTYVFQTNDANVSGGQIRIFPNPNVSGTFCMDAGSNPAVGTAVTLQSCSTSNPPIAQQVFFYRADLSIELVSSASPGVPGLCLDTSDSTTHAAGSAIVLKRCAVADANAAQPTQTSVCPSGYTPASYSSAYPTQTCAKSPWNQQWSVDDAGHLQGAANAGPGNTGTDIDGYCIDAAAQSANTALLLQNCSTNVSDTRETWVPSPTTGAGMAGAGVNQLVNYQQFATCVDVTGAVVTVAFLIAYTCKQNPNPSKVTFNQKFTPSPALQQQPTTTLLTVTAGSTTYCLQSPGTVGGYPTLSTPCPSSPTGNFAWLMSQRYTTNATGAQELPYSSRYTIVDYTGQCLALGSNNDLWNGQYSKIVVTGCNGSTAQKWNANPSTLKASLINTHELNSTGG